LFFVCIPFDAACQSASHILPHVTSWLAPVPASLRLLFFPVVALAGVILVRVSAPPPDELDLGRVFFWIVVKPDQLGVKVATVMVVVAGHGRHRHQWQDEE